MKYFENVSIKYLPINIHVLQQHCKEVQQCTSKTKHPVKWISKKDQKALSTIQGQFLYLMCILDGQIL